MVGEGSGLMISGGVPFSPGVLNFIDLVFECESLPSPIQKFRGQLPYVYDFLTNLEMSFIFTLYFEQYVNMNYM